MTNPNQDTEGQHREGRDGVGSEVWVAVFEELEAHEDGKDVHVGRVELEVDASGAEVVAGRHHPDHEQGETHGVEDPVVIVHPTFVLLLGLHADDNVEEDAEDHVADVAEKVIPHEQLASQRLQTPEVVEAVVLVARPPGN